MRRRTPRQQPKMSGMDPKCRHCRRTEGWAKPDRPNNIDSGTQIPLSHSKNTTPRNRILAKKWNQNLGVGRDKIDRQDKISGESQTRLVVKPRHRAKNARRQAWSLGSLPSQKLGCHLSSEWSHAHHHGSSSTTKVEQNELKSGHELRHK
jgi:hypothetical protein